MAWKVTKIQEADYGCEERAAGEKVKVVVTMTDENGEKRQQICEDDWLYANNIDVGSIWPQ